jgi:hypothetical protein
MAQHRKILALSIFIVAISLGGVFLIYFYQNYQKNFGTLRVVLFPKNATININDRLYHSPSGIFTLQLPAKTYQITFSYPSYSSLQKSISIQSQKKLDLGVIYLFPKTWPKEELISDKAIEKFFSDSEANRFIYFKKIAKNYDWYLYDRNTKENTKFYQTTILPQTLIFSPDSKKIITMLKDNEWQVLFLPKSLIEQPLNLNNEFSLGLKQNNLQTKQTPILQQVIYFPNDINGDILLKTNQGLYRFNYIERTTTQLVNTSTSPFVLSNNALYYVKNNGLFVKLNLSNLEETPLSLMSFHDSQDDLNNLIIKKASSKELFLIISSTNQAFLVSSSGETPLLLGDNIKDGNFSLEDDALLLYLKNKTVIQYDIAQNKKRESNIISDSLPLNFLNNQFFLFSSSSSLNLYDFQSKETNVITDDLKNNNFLYDSSLNYIFYLSQSGINKISF